MAERKPAWIRKRLIPSQKAHALKKRLRQTGLHTVCESASCPNINECFSLPTATFLLLGNRCTRRCGFCGVHKGAPQPVDREEPLRIAELVAELGLRHVVITSVTRDDLPDGGASHFAKTIALIRERTTATIEILTPDFFPQSPLQPDIFNHNIETVPRLYPLIRPFADYGRSLALLRKTKAGNRDLVTKSGMMLGLGETHGEVLDTLQDLRDAECDVVTLGQYLQPSPRQRPVVAYISPERFEEYRIAGETMGFRRVIAGPLVRSSYRAGEVLRPRQG